jgi:DnaJ-class molecular chaperone
MFIHEALTLLGLSWSDRNNTQAINRAWRHKLLSVHPDRNTSCDATERAQQLNQAKDVLLAQFEDPLAKMKRQADEERVAAEKEKAAYEQELEEMKRKAKQDQRDRYTKNRKKRVEGTRIHRKIEDYPEGKALIEEMTTFFKDNFVSKCEHVSMADMMDLFTKSRDNTSDLEKRLFHRHARRLFVATWPYARYTKHFNKWTFYGVALKVNE